MSTSDPEAADIEAGVQPVAIVTAASRGIGRAIARRLASQGYRLVMLARGDDIHEAAAEVGAIAVQGSVIVAEDLRRTVRTAVERFGRLDGVVNNTGTAPHAGLLEIGDDAWHDALDLLVLNVVRMAREATPVLKRSGGGAIVNVSSFAAAEPDAAYPLSSVLRAALGGFTKLYADRYAKVGIRMNSVLPGFIDSAALRPERLAQIPALRYGRVGELAATVAFLLSPESGYITGQSLLVDGGLVGRT